MEKKFMYVDDIAVELNGEKNVLEVIRKAGIDMPTLCYHPELSIYGACRMCMFENERGGLDAACSAQPRAGMKVYTNTERLRKYRKNIIELLLANHCRDCNTCEKNGNCKLQQLAKRYDVRTVRFPNTAKTYVDDSSVSITRDASKCILCGQCVRMCNEIQSVGAIHYAHRGSHMLISTAFERPIAETVCVGCGQCAAVCPVGAITIKQDTAKVWKAIADKNLVVTAQVAPAVRVAIGKELNMPEGTDVMGKLVAAMHRMGIDKVYDTSVSADLTILEETAEFVEHLGKNTGMPLFTSCCPGWIQFAEKKHPEIMPYISTCKSPMQMLSALIVEQQKDCEKKHFNIAVMPCTGKKFEAARSEFTHDGKPDVDAVITTQELIHMIRTAGIEFDTVVPEAIDAPFGMFSGAGVIFGATGGVMEAALRTVAEKITGKELQSIEFAQVRGTDGIKEATVPVGDLNVRIAVAHGLGNARKLLERIRSGEASYEFVEIMACPGGCVTGGGQPIVSARKQMDINLKAERAKALYSEDANAPFRTGVDRRMMPARPCARAMRTRISSSCMRNFSASRADTKHTSFCTPTITHGRSSNLPQQIKPKERSRPCMVCSVLCYGMVF